MRLSVVIPCYRSAATVGPVVRSLVHELERLPGVTPEIVLVDDGSPDGTGAALARLAADHGIVRVITLPRNRGQHPALLAGIAAAAGEVIVTMDDDGQHPPGDLAALLIPLADPRTDLVYGVARDPGHGRMRGLASRAVKLGMRAAGVRHAAWIGPYRAFRTRLRERFPPLDGVPDSRLNLDVLLGAAADRVVPVHVAGAPRLAGRSNYSVGMLLQHAAAMLGGTRTRRVAAAGLVLLALLAWGPALLAPDARYWDDWFPLGLDYYADVGIPWVGPLAALLTTAGPVAFKLVALAATAATGVVLLRVLARGTGLGAGERWLVAALVTVLPMNPARVGAAILLTYTLSLLLFVVAWALLVRPRARVGVVRLVAVTVLFAASFTTPSLLVWVALPVAHRLLLDLDRARPLRPQAVDFARRFAPLLAAPFVFWTVKTLFFPPVGQWEGYNGFAAWGSPLPLAARVVLVAVAVLLVGLVVLGGFAVGSGSRGSRLSAAVGAGGAVLVAGAGLWQIRGADSPSALLVCGLLGLAGAIVVGWAVLGAPTGPRDPLGLVGAGLLALALAVLPYALVGKLPSFDDWHHRHQLLLPLGVALIVAAALRMLGSAVPVRPVRWASVAVVAVATALSAGLSFALVADAHRQQQVIAAFARDDLPASATVVIVDETQQWGFLGRDIRFPEYTSWLQAALGGDARVAVARDDLGALLAGRFDRVLDERARLGIEGWQPNAPVVERRIVAVEGASWWSLLIGVPSVTIDSEP